MSMNSEQWLKLLQEISHDLPWLIKLWRQIKDGSEKPVRDVEVVQIGDSAYDVGTIHHYEDQASGMFTGGEFKR